MFLKLCAQHRRWLSNSDGNENNYVNGIAFWLPDGTQIVNFPKQHADNCTTKHQGTNNRFKPVVRMYKNMRNRMIDDGYLKKGVAPSYFIEGMLSCVPAGQFVGSFQDYFCNTFNWMLKADKTKLVCANGLYLLVFDKAHNCWPTANFDAYMAAAQKYWEDWK